MDADNVVALRLAEARKAHARGRVSAPLEGEELSNRGSQAAPGLGLGRLTIARTRAGPAAHVDVNRTPHPLARRAGDDA